MVYKILKPLTFGIVHGHLKIVPSEIQEVPMQTNLKIGKILRATQNCFCFFKDISKEDMHVYEATGPSRGV